MNPFDPEMLALKESPEKCIKKPNIGSQPPRHKKGELFLKGPIPQKWLARAARLRGKALAVGLTLWFRAGMDCSRKIILRGTDLQKFCISQRSSYRALLALERAGLVTVNRRPGRSPEVTLVDVAGTKLILESFKK